jgi:hypothetical protein
VHTLDLQQGLRDAEVGGNGFNFTRLCAQLSDIPLATALVEPPPLDLQCCHVISDLTHLSCLHSH